MTEYSLLFPLVPTTPANTKPVPIPMLHSVFIFSFTNKTQHELINENPMFSSSVIT